MQGNQLGGKQQPRAQHGAPSGGAATWRRRTLNPSGAPEGFPPRSPGRDPQGSFVDSPEAARPLGHIQTRQVSPSASKLTLQRGPAASSVVRPIRAAGLPGGPRLLLCQPLEDICRRRRVHIVCGVQAGHGLLLAHNEAQTGAQTDQACCSGPCNRPRRHGRLLAACGDSNTSVSMLGCKVVAEGDGGRRGAAGGSEVGRGRPGGFGRMK